MDPLNLSTEHFNYHLPQEKIASYPLKQRDASKLLIYKEGKICNEQFMYLAQQLPADSILILNDTKVIEARILFQKDSGGLIEIFCLEPFEQSMELALQKKERVQWKCLVGGASKWKHGLLLKKNICIGKERFVLSASYIKKLDESFIIEFNWNSAHSFIDVLHASGSIPLPPYIKRKADDIDISRYQTIFGKHDGSVAAPTAALHFTETVFKKLEEKNIHKEFITLNVGAGTFKPVKSEHISGHLMHGEDFTITKKVIEKIIAAKTIIAVGTTSLRTLESIHWLGVKLITEKKNDWTLNQWEAYELNDEISYQQSLTATLEWMKQHSQAELHCRTSLLIQPGYKFKIPQALITNFHQPQSTLLFLVAAFIGEDWKQVYKHALKDDYRFLSYGDSSLLWRNNKVVRGL